MMGEGLVIGVLGLGEAGSAIAVDLLKLGIQVQGYDPIPERSVNGIVRVKSEIEAVQGAQIILSVNWARVAVKVAQTVCSHLGPPQLYAELNTASPRQKQAVAGVIESTGAAFADVALMSTVPGNGVRTPALVSGSGAKTFAEVFSGFGMPVSSLGREAGTAAARKLVRSVFFKGMSAAVGEALEAARCLGCEADVRENIAQTLEAADARLIDRLEQGSRQHAKRRSEEMAAATAMLQDLGITPLMTMATRDWLEMLEKNKESV